MKDQVTLRRFKVNKRVNSVETPLKRCEGRSRKGRQCDNYQVGPFCASHQRFSDAVPDLPVNLPVREIEVDQALLDRFVKMN